MTVRDKLGPGVVQEIGRDGDVRVHWPLAELDTWVAHDELETLERRARLITVYRGGADAHRTLQVCKIVTGAGLSHNWMVELFPENVIRTVRSDGLAWTFDWNPVVERAQPHGTVLEEPLAEDDHAEALTVAELSIA